MHERLQLIEMTGYVPTWGLTITENIKHPHLGVEWLKPVLNK